VVEAVLKFAMAFTAYTATGLLVVEMSTSRRRVLESLERVQEEQQKRHRAEDQLRALAASSPAAILTLDRHATVLAANQAAHHLLGAEGELRGTSVADLLPLFANALEVASGRRAIRTSATGWACRRDGHRFPIQSWFSVYGEGASTCLAAIVVDISEEVRDREREHFQQLVDHNRLLASAVSHEIRNFCSAISVVCSNLEARADLRGNADFDALVRLVGGLKELASLQLGRAVDRGETADLRALLEQLRIIIEPDWDDLGGGVSWSVPEGLPPVAAGPHGLLQIFLNLCQNSLRAVDGCPVRRLSVAVDPEGDDLVVTFADTGPGVATPETLFQLHPPGPGNAGSGLGLYLSREIARSVGGDLVHAPSTAGAWFRVTIPVARPPELTRAT
jgi:two-component system sensor kinase FixL